MLMTQGVSKTLLLVWKFVTYANIKYCLKISQFLLDILKKNQEQVSTDTLDLYTLQHVVEFVIQAFLDEKVLLLPVVNKSMSFRYSRRPEFFFLAV
jgi:hypothetical protein